MKIINRNIRLTLIMMFAMLGNIMHIIAQEYKVESFEIVPKDITARTNGRIDGNGRKCAVIKVYVKDAITDTDGPVVGEIRDRGMEKWVYVTHDAKKIGLLFKEHMPLQITFADYDYPSLTGQMTYILKLVDVSSPSTVQTVAQNSNNQSANTPPAPAQSLSMATTSTSSTSGYINGHEWVDLGLPSGTKWATCNVGASKPEESGDYFAYGEVLPKTDYSKETSLTFGKKESELRSSGIIDSKNALTMQSDAANINWGGKWRIPNEDECRELMEKCKWEWTTLNGQNGMKVVGPNRNSIFIPVVGRYEGTSLVRLNEIGNYGSSTVVTSNNNESKGLGLTNYINNPQWIFTSDRYKGYPIRPVIQ